LDLEIIGIIPFTQFINYSISPETSKNNPFSSVARKNLFDKGLVAFSGMWYNTQKTLMNG
jgi:hypothetical protein